MLRCGASGPMSSTRRRLLGDMAARLWDRSLAPGLGVILIGLIVAQSVAQGSLLQMEAGSTADSIAKVVFLVGAGLSLSAHQLAQRALSRLAEGRSGTRRKWRGELVAAVSGP